jgi:hypothetical protein
MIYNSIYQCSNFGFCFDNIHISIEIFQCKTQLLIEKQQLLIEKWQLLMGLSKISGNIGGFN